MYYTYILSFKKKITEVKEFTVRSVIEIFFLSRKGLKMISQFFQKIFYILDDVAVLLPKDIALRTGFLKVLAIKRTANSIRDIIEYQKIISSVVFNENARS